MHIVKHIMYTGSYIFSQTIFSAKRGVKSRLNGTTTVTTTTTNNNNNDNNNNNNDNISNNININYNNTNTTTNTTTNTNSNINTHSITINHTNTNRLDGLRGRARALPAARGEAQKTLSTQTGLHLSMYCLYELYNSYHSVCLYKLLPVYTLSNYTSFTLSVQASLLEATSEGLLLLIHIDCTQTIHLNLGHPNITFTTTYQLLPTT